MFADPVSNLMLIILLFFAGLLVMFIFILRSLELGTQNQEEISRQIAMSLTDLERKVAELAFALREKTGGEADNLSGERSEPSPQAAGQSPEHQTGLAERD